jgi:hypothetical protein
LKRIARPLQIFLITFRWNLAGGGTPKKSTASKKTSTWKSPETIKEVPICASADRNLFNYPRRLQRRWAEKCACSASEKPAQQSKARAGVLERTGLSVGIKSRGTRSAGLTAESPTYALMHLTDRPSFFS